MEVQTEVYFWKKNGDTNQACAMDAKCRFEVGCLVKIVLKTFTQRVTVGPDKIRLHFRLADHAISDTHQFGISELATTGEISHNHNL